MALFGKDRERVDRPRPAGPEAGIVPVATDPVSKEVTMLDRERERVQPEETGQTSAFLGKGSRVIGKLSFEGTVRIEGHVEGEITAQDTLVIGESAVVNAQITGSAIVIHGRVTGDVTARKRLEVRAPGKLFGNISTPSLVIHEGVVFEGQCTMGAAETPRAEKDRKIAVFPKDGQGDGAAHKLHELAK